MRPDLGKDVQDEIEHHLRESVDALMAQGWDEGSAWSESRRRFGELDATTGELIALQRRRARRTGRREWAWSIASDLRVAARLLWKSPGFAVASIALIAVGVSASTAAYSLIQMVFSRSPYPDADRLAIPFQLVPRSDGSAGDTLPWSYQQALELGRHVPSFESTAALFTMFEETILLGPSGAERVVIQLVSPAYFQLLGARPELGRLMAPSDSASYAAWDVAILSHELWTTRFGADPRIIGSVVRLNGIPFSVAGVVDRGFRGLGTGADVWLPFEALRVLSPPMGPFLDDPLAVGGPTVVARLRSGATADDARPYVAAIAAATGDLMPAGRRAPGAKWDGGVTSLLEAQVPPELGSLLRLLALAVVALVLIVCANHASLLLARMKQRSRGASIRRALGASGGRLARQTLVENLLPVGLGGILGVAMAPLLINAVVTSWPEPPFSIVLLRHTDLLRSQPFPFDWPVLLFAVAVILTVTVLVSLGPVWSIVRSDPMEWLRDNRGARSLSRAHGRRALVVGEITLATALLLAALLITQSMTRLLGEDTGIRPIGVLTSTLNFSQAAPSPEARAQLANELVERLSADPGVEAVSLGTCMPLDRVTCLYSRFGIDGQPALVEGAPYVALQFVTPGYFQSLGIPVLAGEGFTASTGNGGPARVWIDEALASMYFGTSSPLGRKIGANAVPEAEIVGVVKSVRQGDLTLPPQGVAYYPMTQVSGTRPVQLFVRMREAIGFTLTDIRRTVDETNPSIAVYDVRSMQAVVDEATANRRLVRDLLVAFSVIAALLVVMGIYSVLAYMVAQTTKEIGIRAALGATPSQVLWPTLREAAWLAGVGLLLGSGVGYAGTGLLEAFLYGVGRTEWETYVTVAALVTISALAAAWVPARNAARLDASIALRHD